MTPLKATSNIHTVEGYAGILCLRCLKCGRRSNVTVERLKHSRAVQSTMTQISDITFRCSSCDSAKIEALLPLNVAEAEAWLKGN